MKNITSKLFQFLSSNSFLLILYFILVSYVAMHHEVWRDEADSWLVARDISVSGLFQFTRNSGHPSLWYWVLIPFAKLGFPNYTLAVIHIFFATATVYLMLFHSTLPRYIVVLLIFGYYFFFEYAVVSRNYALSNFLLFSIATMYQKRFEKPILFGFILLLLANCNIYATILTSGIGLIFFIEIIEQKKYESKVLTGLSLIILGGILCVLQVLPSDDRQASPTNSGIFHMINSMALPLSIVYSFTPGIVSKRAFFGFLILPIAFIAFYPVKKVFIFFVWVISIICLFFTLIYMGGHRHAGFLLLTLIFALWIKPFYQTNSISEKVYESLSDYSLSFFKEPEKLLQVALTISLILSVKFSLQESKKEIKYSFSNAKEMSQYILANGYDDEKYTISTHNPDRGKTILYFLKNKKTLYYPALDSFGSHMWWNKKMSQAGLLEMDDMVEKTRKEFSGKDNILFLSDTLLKEDNERYELIYATTSRIEFVKDENFYLYKLK